MFRVIEVIKKQYQANKTGEWNSIELLNTKGVLGTEELNEIDSKEYSLSNVTKSSYPDRHQNLVTIVQETYVFEKKTINMSNSISKI